MIGVGAATRPPLHQRLRAARESRGLSVDDLAQSAHLGRTMLYEIEAGRLTDLRRSTIRALAVALQIRACDLCDLCESPAPPPPPPTPKPIQFCARCGKLLIPRGGQIREHATDECIRYLWQSEKGLAYIRSHLGVSDADIARALEG